MIRFAEPWAFALAIPLVALAVWVIRSRRRLAPKLTFSSTELAAAGRPTIRTALRTFPRGLLLAAVGLLIVALARPQTPWSERRRLLEGIDIMLVLDVSESMRALDFRPNRLEKAKEVVKEFILGRVEDQIGLVIFGQEAFTLCPLTHDYAALETFVNRIDFDLVNGQHTAIGMGLANAVNRLKDSPAKSKVVILLTDGENNWGEIAPLTAAELARQLHMRVYTIGVGSRGPVDMPVRAANGQTYVQRVMASIDIETLRRIAEATGGTFFEATDGKKLEEIYRQIDQMERSKREVTETNYFDERAPWAIIPALVLLVAACLLENTLVRSFP